MVEQVAAHRDWAFERLSDDEITLAVAGKWADYTISFSWHDNLEGLHLACSFDFKVPAARREEVLRLIALVNEQIWLGHFDIWAREGTLMYRNGLLLSGEADINPEQCEQLLQMSLEACERYFPAFQFVIWAGKSAQEAVRSSLFETVGLA